MKPSRLPLLAAAVCAAWMLAQLARGAVAWTPAFGLAACAYWRLWELHRERLWSERPGWALFWAFLALYLSTFRWKGGDDTPNSLIPFALLRHGTFALDAYVDKFFGGFEGDFTNVHFGHRLSNHPVGPGLMAVPVALVPILAGVEPDHVILHSISKITAAIVTAASVAAFHAAIARRCSAAWALCLSVLYGAGSWAMSVSGQALYLHGPAQLGLTLGLLGLERSSAARASGEGARETAAAWDTLAGLGFALAFAVRPDHVFFLAAAGAFVLFHERRRLPRFALGCAAPLAFLAWYWLHYTGRLAPPEAGWQSGHFKGFQTDALLGLTLSPTRGLFWFFPAAAFSVWAAWLRRREPPAAWLAAACAGSWLFFCFYVNWIGGQTFGSRYLAGVGLVLAWLLADAGVEAEIRSRPAALAAFSGAAAFSVLVHTVGAYLSWPGSSALIAERADLWRWGLHPIPALLDGENALSGLPFPARAAIVAAALAATAAAALRLRRRLSLRHPPP